jgi:hypothetical protein
MKLCKHEPHTTIDWVREPRYHDDSILLHKGKMDLANEHLIIKFVKCNKYPDWFYMSKKDVVKQKVQANGKGEVYVVSMKKAKPFTAIKMCNHMNSELF